MIWDAQHIHHQLMLFLLPCCDSQQPPRAASVSTSSTQMCLRVLYLDWARMLIHCAQHSQHLCAKSHEAAIDELGSAAYCIINQRCCAILTATNVHSCFNELNCTWIAAAYFISCAQGHKIAKKCSAGTLARYLPCWSIMPTATAFFLGAHTSNLDKVTSADAL